MNEAAGSPQITLSEPNVASAKGHEGSLRSLYESHRGKVSDKWSIYLDVYDRIFLEFRNRPVRLLEIGVQNGGSLEIWRQYFPNAELVLGCDINKACGELSFDHGNISVVVGDVSSKETETNIFERSEEFDIVIDDGSHRSSDIVRAFARYFPRVSDGGIYVVEDLHCSYWKRFEGGLYDPLSSVSFFKRLLDVINHEHWGLDRLRTDIFATFATRYNVRFEEASLASIHAIEFINSLSIVRKRSVQENILGHRRVGGRVALVEKGVLPLDGSINLASDEVGNPWSLRSMTLEEEIAIGRELVGRHEALSEKMVEAHEKIQSDQDEIARARLHANDLEARLTKSERTIQEFKNSTSWRITGPLRALSATAKSFFHSAHRVARSRNRRR